MKALLIQFWGIGFHFISKITLIPGSEANVSAFLSSGQKYEIKDVLSDRCDVIYQLELVSASGRLADQMMWQIITVSEAAKEEMRGERNGRKSDNESQSENEVKTRMRT